MKKLFVFAIAIVVLGLALTNSSQAQFKNGVSTIGPSIGLSFLGSQPQFGVNFESAFSGETYGTWAWGLIGRYWSYSEGIYSYDWKYTNILIGGTVALHFKVGDGKFDPAVGIALAYDIQSYTAPAGYVDYYGYSPSKSFLAFLPYGHLRYWFSPTFAGTVRLGAGSGSYGGIDLGVDFRL